MNAGRCDIILPTCGHGGLVRGCIESLIKHTKYPCRLIVIDNSCGGDISGLLEKYSRSGKLDMVLLKQKENIGWIRSINAGLDISKDSEYVCLQNDDTIFTEGWLEELVRVFEDDRKIGLANPEWHRPEDVDIDTFAAELKRFSGQVIDTDWCRGHCFFIRREVISKLGGLDTAYLPGYYDDRDYSLKAIAAGYRCVKAKAAFVEHLRNSTIMNVMEKEKVRDLMDRNGRTFYRRWGHPVRVAFVLRNKKGSGPILKEMCMDQNKVIVITDNAGEVPYEHTNMKVMALRRPFFNWKALFSILARPGKRQHKGVGFVFTDDPSFHALIAKFRGLIPADIVFETDMNRLSEKAARIVKNAKEAARGSI
ncbi:MAG: glycosyltransferase [Candidatus Omnitrophica bacterium]|nr:glycosyltransferase [Candidatus Omnitrophota bacterium]